MKKIFCPILIAFLLLGVNPAFAAGPMLKFTPSSGTYTNGSTFTVKVGIDSGTEKTQAVDIWATFDSSKLEVVSIEQATNTFNFLFGGKNIYNDTGKFDISTFSSDQGTYEGTVLVGDLAVVTFKAKALGTAHVDFVCQSGSNIDSNIINMSGVDVINCASNINGIYTITDGGTSDPDPTAVPTNVPSSGDETDAELPKTGSVGTTIGLMIFGIVGVLSSLALRFL